jgi:prepilin-type N-terminal cleavage/methylation domain-containing protein
MKIRRHNRNVCHVQQEANRSFFDSLFFARPGFSLIELLIVLGILTVMAALVVPRLRGPLDDARLRSAAVDVQNAWGKARSLAIREGATMTFRCEPNGQRWWIERKVQRPSSDNRQHDVNGADPKETSDSLLVREGRLPDGVLFDRLQFRRALNATRTRPRADDWGDELLATATPKRQTWSEPLYFEPTGRSQDARVYLTGPDSMAVSVKIRGLTAAVSFNAPFRRRNPRATSEILR